MLNYDLFAEQYDAMVKKGGPRKVHDFIIDQLKEETELKGKMICDLGCGQGELAHKLSIVGAKVTGIDRSQKLLSHAKNLTDQVNWVEGDAMDLSAFQDGAFDIVISSIMFMDVPDHQAIFNESYRILKKDGIMIWVVMHPCFQSPFCLSMEDGSRNVSQYASQYWKSNGKGTLRSVLGAYHRPISQYVNDFMKSGFALDRIFEPDFERNLPDHFGGIGRKR
jgi:ubiquinone/menaquinone biosynthesis C-methylase UbiE